MIDLRRESTRILKEDFQPNLFHADAQELDRSGREIALSCAQASRDEMPGHPIAEAERWTLPARSLGLPLGMRIDPRTTELRTSLRAEYERSGRPPLDSEYNAEPLVSVIIPCYNYGYYLEDAILSAMRACSHPLEILVVDDGSTEAGSLEAVEDLAGRYRFRLLRQRNVGQNGARYEGFRYSRGKFIQFLDADDLLAPGKIDLQVEMMTAASNVDIAVCEYELCDASGEGRHLIRPSTLAGFAFTADDFLLRWERGFSLPIHCALFRRDVLDPDQFPRITKSGKEDWIFWIVIASKSPRFQFHSDVLAVYRLHGHNTFTNREGMGIDFLRACMYLLQSGHNTCENFLEASIDHFRKAYLGPIRREPDSHVTLEATQAAHYKNLADELQQKYTDAETRLTQAASQAAHYQNVGAELQQKYTDAQTRLAQAASQAAHYKTVADELQQKYTDAGTRLAQAESQAAHYKNLADELRQKYTDAHTRLAQAESQAAHYKNLADELRQKYTDAQTRLAEAASQAVHYKNVADELQQKYTDAQTRLAEAASQAGHYKNVADELQQKYTDAQTRLAEAASQAAHYKNLVDDAENRLAQAASQAADYKSLLKEQQRQRADAENRLAQAASQAADYKAVLEEQRQQLIDLESLRVSHQAALSEGTAFRQSLSWRITAPLRYLGSVLRFR